MADNRQVKELHSIIMITTLNKHLKIQGRGFKFKHTASMSVSILHLTTDMHRELFHLVQLSAVASVCPMLLD